MLEDSKFLGYVVHLPHSDEFLAMSEEDEISEQRMWAKIPGMAIIYNNKKAAKKEAKSYGKGALVVKLFDAGDQYIVAQPK